MEPRPPPYPLPRFYNTGEHCEYHQTPGHTLNKCFRLRHDIQDLINDSKVSFDLTLTNPPPNTNIIQNPLPDHKPPKGLNMIGITGIQFNPASYITKASEPKKVIFLPDINHISTIGRHAPKPVPPPEYEHLLTHMWNMALESSISVLPPDINIYGDLWPFHITPYHPTTIIVYSTHWPFISMPNHQHSSTNQNLVLTEQGPIGLPSWRSCKPWTIKIWAGRAHSFYHPIW